MIYLEIAGAVILVSIIGLLCFAWAAPLGYEDETGFHYGRPPAMPLRRHDDEGDEAA